MEQVTVEASLRMTGRASELRQLREAGQIPGVLYGQHSQPLAISVPEQSIAMHVGHGEMFVELHLGGQTFHALVHRMQRDPLTRRVIHVDFYRVDVRRKVDVRVPVHVHGVKDVEHRGGIVQQQVRDVELRGLPADTPEFISIDAGNLHIGEHLTVADIVLPPRVELRSDGDEVIVTVLAPRRSVEDAPEPAAPTEEAQERSP